MGVPPLYELGYSEIREFANRAMQILAKNMPSAKHIALTIHGPGYGLDETECFLAQIAGLVDAFRSEAVPPFLQQITIVEKNQGRSAALTKSSKSIFPQDPCQDLVTENRSSAITNG